jgi:hypothetical protein
MILAKAKANLARTINYDHNVRCKLKRTFTIVHCSHETFIVQATGASDGI